MKKKNKTYRIDLITISFFSSPKKVDNVLSIDENKLEKVCVDLNISFLNSEQLAFLREYHQVVSLVAAALNTIEANKYTFGMYLPVLIGFQYNLNIMIKELSKPNARKYVVEFVNDDADIEIATSNCLPLAIAIKNGFDRRFGHLIDPHNVHSIPLYVAMLSNPIYKLDFLGMKMIPPALYERLKDMLVDAAFALYQQENPIENESSQEGEKNRV